MFQSLISNEDLSSLPSLMFKGEIVVVDREEQIGAACRDLLSEPIIGFDTETRPSFKAGVSYKVSLLQLSTKRRCYLFRLNKIALDREILRVLESTTTIKVGADVAGDMRSLNGLRRFKERGFIDLQHIAWQWGVEELSLRKMSAIVLGSKISKAQRLSNWEAATLTEQQQGYAATDAWSCIEIYEKLIQSPKLTQERIDQIVAERKAAAQASAERKATREAARANNLKGRERQRNRQKRTKRDNE
ncbi:MAG: 3'-5' exonuclease [Rikenellaceae bacterium]